LRLGDRVFRGSHDAGNLEPGIAQVARDELTDTLAATSGAYDDGSHTNQLTFT
jgi:hypothetical protein